MQKNFQKNTKQLSVVLTKLEKNCTVMKTLRQIMMNCLSYYIEELKLFLQNGTSVIYDATNINSKRRRAF